MTDTVQVEGLGALIRALKGAGEGLDDLKDANRNAGNIVLNSATALAPRRTGRLVASGRTNRAAKKASVIFGKARVPYAGPIHFGWRARNIKPNPWMTNAATRTESQWIAAYSTDIQALLDAI